MSSERTKYIEDITGLLSPIMDDGDRRKLATVLLGKAEALAQTETDQDKEEIRKGILWFKLRLIVGYSSIVMLGVVLLFATYIIGNHSDFEDYIVKSAIAALFVDILGVLVFTWKVILKND